MTRRVVILTFACVLIGWLVSSQKLNLNIRSVNAATETKSPNPLVLQEEDGDRLIHRAGPLRGLPFIIKVDGEFGNSEDFFAFSEQLGPGQTIPFHKHENAEEILVFEQGDAVVVLGDKRSTVHSHGMLFIPRNTWISATNKSKEDVSLLAIFSRHGFESYMRSISAKPGEPLTPLSQDELTRLRTLGHAVYWDTSKGDYPPGVAHF
jgi:hypothetical protein